MKYAVQIGTPGFTALEVIGPLNAAQADCEANRLREILATAEVKVVRLLASPQSRGELRARGWNVRDAA